MSGEPEQSRESEQTVADVVESASIDVELSLAAIGTVPQSGEPQQSREPEHREPVQLLRPTDVVESAAVPGKLQSGMCHLSVRSFYSMSTRGRPLKRPVASYSPPLEKKRRKR